MEDFRNLTIASITESQKKAGTDLSSRYKQFFWKNPPPIEKIPVQKGLLSPDPDESVSRLYPGAIGSSFG